MPVESATFLYLAEAAEKTGHAQAARRALLDYRALAITPDARSPVLAERIADLSMRLGEAGVAVEWYKHAAEGPRASPALLARLAHAQLQAGDATAAAATLGRILERDPDNALARGIERKLKSLISNR
jgi:hypothetical protein